MTQHECGNETVMIAREGVSFKYLSFTWNREMHSESSMLVSSDPISLQKVPTYLPGLHTRYPTHHVQTEPPVRPEMEATGAHRRARPRLRGPRPYGRLHELGSARHPARHTWHRLCECTQCLLPVWNTNTKGCRRPSNPSSSSYISSSPNTRVDSPDGRA